VGRCWAKIVNGLRTQEKKEGGLRVGLGCGAGLEAACGKGFGLSSSSFFSKSHSLSKQANQFEFKPGFESKHPKTMHWPECNAHNYLFNLEKSNKGFFLYYIPCKEDKSWQNFKIKRKLLFNFSSYAHPEIWEFQGVTTVRSLVQPKLKTKTDRKRSRARTRRTHDKHCTHRPSATTSRTVRASRTEANTARPRRSTPPTHHRISQTVGAVETRVWGHDKRQTRMLYPKNFAS
jgi:hypothetical protein